MKKIICLIFCVLLLTCFVGCEDDSVTNSNTAEQVATKSSYKESSYKRQ